MDIEKMKEIDVLKAWYFLESIKPGELEKNKKIPGNRFSDGKVRVSINQLDENTSPWKTIQPVNPDEEEIRFQYFIDCYPEFLLIEELRTLFNNNDELINKNNKRFFGFTFLVDQNGNYLDDSLFIPLLHLVLYELKNNRNLSVEGLHEKYEQYLIDLKEQAKAYFANGVNYTAIELMQKEVKKQFYYPESNKKHYYLIKLQKKSEEDNDSNFNSFFLEDLKKIIQRGTNKTLSHYINGKELKENINENRDVVEEILQPKNLPLGRWPSPVNHRLSLMQQVAVNYSINSSENIISVNGPPGTGKTTLLKDIFAHLIVERAKVMTSYGHPSEAFKKIGQFQIEGTLYRYNIYELDKKLTEYSMVVASSNNGAVENISKELPKQSEIIRNHADEKEQNIYSQYDKTYARLALELDFFPQLSSKVIQSENETWGLFSAALGNSKNIKDVCDAFNSIKISKDSNVTSFAKILEIEEQKLSDNVWEDAVIEFNNLYKNIKKKIEKLQSFVDLRKKYVIFKKNKNDLKKQLDKAKQFLNQLSNEAISLEKQKQLINEQIINLPKPSFFNKLLGKVNPEEIKLRQQLNQLNKKLLIIEKDKKDLHKQIDGLSNKIKQGSQIEEQYIKEKAFYDKQNLILSTDEYWDKGNYEYRQQNVIWQTDELNFERGLLFLKAMYIHKLFIIKSYKEIKFALALLSNRYSLNLNDSQQIQYVRSMWNVLHLITPVISTTLASFSSMYRGIDTEFIAYLFIDEAGQASPQQAAGSLWRSNKAIVMGDPLQIEPVVTLDRTILNDIRQKFHVDEQYIGLSASVQNLADLANPYGMYKNKCEQNLRIGIPLWVHRRCKNPMFSIANTIAYDNQMVLASNKKKEPGIGHWYHCTGKVKQAQYVEEQGKFVVNKIKEMYLDKKDLPKIYVITPFTIIAREIKNELKKELKQYVNEKELFIWINHSVGTVHTFQGKEADTVFFVTGTDENTDAAANWSCSKPNLLNVAVTRAKEEFYVVGDFKRLSQKKHYSIIAQHVTNNFKSEQQT
jgi:tRNA A37 threonylcarbamoyladenosine biosynthesis protein TsaE